MAAMFSHGWLSPEHNAILGENLDIIVSAIVGLLTVLYALVKRPSAKAMSAAKEIDAEGCSDQDVGWEAIVVLAQFKMIGPARILMICMIATALAAVGLLLNACLAVRKQHGLKR